jgi:hypothetical protein
LPEIKKEDSKSDYVIHEKQEKPKNSQITKKIEAPPTVTTSNNINHQAIPLNWRTVEIDGEQDLDS